MLADYGFDSKEFPPLPDGLFWDIRPGTSYHLLGIRRKLFIDSTRVAWECLWPRGGTASVDELRRTLRYAMGKDEFLVACRKRRKRFGSKVVIDNRIYANFDEWKAGEVDSPTRIEYVSDELFTPEAILGTAKHLLTKWHERDAKHMRYEKNKALLGDYPPNTLEGK